MVRHAILLVALAVACVSCAANDLAYVGFELDVRSAPPPPRVVFVDEPDYVVVEGSRVYVVENVDQSYDMFRYESTWYLCYQGYWYRSSSYNGSYTVVNVRSVPRAVVSVPERHWRHHPHGGPPGQEKKREGWGA